MEDVAGDVDDLNHCSLLVVETDEVLDLQLNVLCAVFLDYLEYLDSNF